MVLRRLILFAWLALGLFPVGLVAQGALPQTLVTVQFLPGWQTDSGARMSGLHLKLAPGWKTYWRSPGDAGIPPDFSWRGSENLRAVKIHWPAPSVYSSYGLRTVGYDGEVILPISVVPRNASQPVRLRAQIQLGVCEQVCVPVSLELDEQLHGKGKSDLNIHQALATLPVPAERAGVGKVVCRFSPNRDGVELSASISMPELGQDEVVLIETSDPRIWVADPQSRRDGKTLHAQTQLVAPAGKPLSLDRKGLRFTVIGRHQAVDINGCSVG